MTTAATTITSAAGMDDGRSDVELVEDVRTGTTSAYAVLYERHKAAAHNLAQQLGRGHAYREELVSTAFLKVLDAVLAGKTITHFRAYLLTALRHTAYDDTRRSRKIEYSEDPTAAQGVRLESVSSQFVDTVVDLNEKCSSVRAFKRLPARWQAVLYYLEIEEMSPAAVAPILGLTPNGVSALAYRAREGLRQAYLQTNLKSDVPVECKTTSERLGAFVRNGLGLRECQQIDGHLNVCQGCRDQLDALREINVQIKVAVKSRK